MGQFSAFKLAKNVRLHFFTETNHSEKRQLPDAAPEPMMTS